MLLTGLVGRSIQASRSPWLHEQEARAQGLDLTYRLFDFTALDLPDDELGRLLRRLVDEGYRGVNITYPFKQQVIALLDALDPAAASVGAVNTVAMRDGRLIGYNTDMSGFRDSLEAGLPGRRQARVLQLGAGGAGAAVANALLAAGAEVLEIADVDPARAEALCRSLADRYGAARVAARPLSGLDLAGVDGVVNATPMGMAAHPSPPLDTDLLEPRHWVADIVYFPLETELLRDARARGCRVLDGSGMAVAQAAGAFEIFTGHKADTA
ncbi:MAG TPA: shikimate dehydrogenase, partial [Novosphingobium sp.]